MALFFIIFIGLLVVLLLWKLGHLSQGALCVAGAALALGLVGYALQGSPAQPGAPVVTKPDVPPTALPDTQTKDELIGKFGAEAEALAQADAYFRIDRPELAARVLRIALDKNPKSPALWTGLGNAMVSHGRGVMSPAAEFCYRRALTLAPAYPGALYFYAVALAENGRIEDAKPIFGQLVSILPKNSPLRERLLTELIKGGLLDAKEAGLSAPAK